MSFYTRSSMPRHIIVILTVIFLLPIYAIGQSNPLIAAQPSTQTITAAPQATNSGTTNEFERLHEAYERKYELLDQKFTNELTQHRQHLQSQYEGFFAGMHNLFMAAISLTVLFAAIIAVAQWIYGGSKREAVENVQHMAESSLRRIEEETKLVLANAEREVEEDARRIAEERVTNLVTEERFRETLQSLFAEVRDDIVSLKRKLTDQFTEDLVLVRDQLLEDKHTVIAKAVDESMRSNFKNELDLLGRIEDIESKLRIMLETLPRETPNAEEPRQNISDNEFSRIINKYTTNTRSGSS